MSAEQAPLRVAIVGQGPKGLYALAELLGRVPTGTPLQVHTFDPHPPGTGAAYDPAQPPWLRLNVTPRIVHLNPLAPMPYWLRARGVDPDGDVPRALVGSYLAEAHRAVVAGAPEGTSVHHHPRAVRRVRRLGDGWLLDEELVVDELLLATGHAPDHDHRLERHWRPEQPTRLVPQAYPVEQWLDEQHVPAGSVVAVRGAALTFIDVALSLTEGRERSRWPARILPIARSGQLLSAKPSRGDRLDEAQRAVLEQAAARVPDDPDGVLALVRRCAGELLAHQLRSDDRTIDPDEADRLVAHTLATGWELDLADRPGRALAMLERSLAVDEGREAPGAAWMLGRTWAGLYPAVVRNLSFTRSDPAAWRRLSAAAAVLERLTYGPLRANAERLVALCHQGVVDLGWLEAGVGIEARPTGIPAGDRLPDVLVDAVNAPPGALTARNPLVDALVADGELQLAPPLRGLLVDEDASCLRDGHPVPGLAALGRVVEDVVIGNDTLGRSLHDQAERWATRVARRAADHTHPTPEEDR